MSPGTDVNAGTANTRAQSQPDNEQQLRRLLALSSDFYWEQDENHHFTSLVAPMLTKSGVDTQQWIGKTLWQQRGVSRLNHSDDWSDHQSALQAQHPLDDFMFQ